jgi:hypothetical protein
MAWTLERHATKGRPAEQTQAPLLVDIGRDRHGAGTIHGRRVWGNDNAALTTTGTQRIVTAPASRRKR